MKERKRNPERWLGPLHRLDLPFKLIWGKLDSVAVYPIAERICSRNPRAKLLSLEDVAHYPQLECPEKVAAAMVGGAGIDTSP